MDTSAIIMMVLFLLVIWGGLALSIKHFLTHPDAINTSDTLDRTGD